MAVKVHEPGRAAAEVVPSLLEDMVSRVPFKKTMRWTDDKHAFGRPLRWLLALLGEQPLELSWGDVKSGDVTHGHRFHAPEPFEVESFADYNDKLRKAYVIVDQNERRAMIDKQVREVAGSVGGVILEDEGLLFSGDQLFAGSIGRTDLPGGSFQQLMASMATQVLVLDDDVMVHPGHGPSTTIGRERASNPFLVEQ